MKGTVIGPTVFIVGLSVVLGLLAYILQPPEQYVAGRLYIRERDITAEVYTEDADPIDGMSSLWNGGKVTTKADLSTVQVGDIAEIYTVEGEHLVLECIGIKTGPSWLEKTDGDVIVINNRLFCRFTRL